MDAIAVTAAVVDVTVLGDVDDDDDWMLLLLLFEDDDGDGGTTDAALLARLFTEKQ